MRKITEQSVDAFLKGHTLNKQNMAVSTAFGTHILLPDYKGELTIMSLHGNDIAIKTKDSLFITNAGWFSNTTKERLNGLINEFYGYPDCIGKGIYQKQGVWYLNNQEWDGKLIELEK